MNQQLLRYYHEVLGINVIPMDLMNASTSAPVTPQVSIWRNDLSQMNIDITHVDCDLLFISALSSVDQESIYCEPSWTLFEKMKKAMGLEHIHVKTLEHIGSSEHELFHDLLKMKARVVIIMKENPERGDFKVSKEFKFLETYSPQRLSQQTDLKKKSWEDLQKVMKIFRDDIQLSTVPVTAAALKN